MTENEKNARIFKAFCDAKHPTRKVSGAKSPLGLNAPRLSGGAPKPQWRKERKICSA